MMKYEGDTDELDGNAGGSPDREWFKRNPSVVCVEVMEEDEEKEDSEQHDEDELSEPSTDQSLVLLCEGMWFSVRAYDDVYPYNQVDFIDWRITKVNTDGSVVAQAMSPEEAANKWKDRIFHDREIVSKYVKNTT